VSRIPALQAYLQKRPGDRFTLYSLALEHRREASFGSAEQCFRELLKAHPDSGAGYLQFGEMLLEIGRSAEGLGVWRAGVEQLSRLSSPEARRSLMEIQAAIESAADLE